MLKDHIPYETEPNIKVLSDIPVSQTNNVLVNELILEFPNKSENSVFLVQSKTGGVFPGIIFLHWLEPHAENSNKKEFLPMAISLAEKYNAVSILPDAFWSTTPEKYKENPHIGWTTEFDNDSRLTETQLVNVLYAIDYLESLSYVNNKKIHFCGHDFGAMIGTLLGSFKPNVRSYVLMAFTGKFSDWYRFGNKLNSVEDFLDYVNKMAKYDPITNIKDINGEIYFQFALNDFYVPVEKALELINKIDQTEKKVSWYKAGHGLSSESFKEAEKWLVKMLNSEIR